MSFTCSKCGEPQEDRTKPIKSAITRKKTYLNYRCKCGKIIDEESMIDGERDNDKKCPFCMTPVNMSKLNARITQGYETVKENDLCYNCARGEGITDEDEDTKEPGEEV